MLRVCNKWMQEVCANTEGCLMDGGIAVSSYSAADYSVVTRLCSCRGDLVYVAYHTGGPKYDVR